MRPFPVPLMTVRGIFGMLFRLHDRKRSQNRRKVFAFVNFFIARSRKIQICQPERITQRIQLVLPFPYPRAVCVAKIARMPPPVRFGIKSIRVRIDENVPELPFAKPAYQRGDILILLRKRNIVHHLRGRIAQPHGGDIPRKYKRQPLRF